MSPPNSRTPMVKVTRVRSDGFSNIRVVGVVATSCATGAGIGELTHALFRLCPNEPVAQLAEEAVPDFLEYAPRARRGPTFRILRTDRGYRVVGTPPPAEELEWQ